ncbi:MAG: GNAT family N-acetyltransferase [Bacteroidetes bacterium]|nr:GNAT family N-acetyltransferase [Bacteroidota bacterium]
MSLTIRKAVPADAPHIVRLIKDLALYEKDPDAAVVTESDILRDAFSDHPVIHTIMADWNGVPVGFALYFYNYSTWQGRKGLYLEDLYVDPPFRKLGIGKGLLIVLARIARKLGCGRVVWQVLDWNTPSIDFYESIGARHMSEWLTYRLEGDAITALASQNPGILPDTATLLP